MVGSRRWSIVVVCMVVRLLGVGGVVVLDENTCMRVGAPEQGSSLQIQGCAWHRSVLEIRHAGNSSCEPSQEWLNASGLFSFWNDTREACYALEEEQCEYSDEEKCLVAQATGECYTPPLQLLRKYVENLVRTFPALFFFIEELPRTCAMIDNNVSCAQVEGCAWQPTNLSKTQPGSEDEVQKVAVFESLEPSPQVQELKLSAVSFDAKVITLTLMARDIAGINPNSAFTLAYRNEETGWISVRAEAEEIEAALVELTVGVPLFQVKVASRTRDKLPMAWEIKFINSVANANDLALGSNNITMVPEKVQFDWPESYDPVMLTRHTHNSQRVTIWSSVAITGGEFILVYRGFDDVSNTLNDRETRLLSVNATTDDVRDALLDLISSGSQALSFVSVTADDTFVGQRNGLTAWKSWIVTFVSDVAEYEIGEYLLIPKYKNAPLGLECRGCDEITFVNSTSPGIVEISAASIVKAPKIVGFFQIETCRFDTTLPGLIYPVVGESIVKANYDGPPRNLTNAGAHLKILGNIYQVAAVSPYSIQLTQPIHGFILPKTTQGFKAYVCTVNAPSQDVSLPVMASPSDFNSYLSTKFPQYKFNVSVASGPNYLNEMAWNISILNPINSFDPFQIFTPQQLGWTASMREVDAGSATVSGSFRLAFAGYTGNESTYETVLLNPDLDLSTVPPTSPVTIKVNDTVVTAITREISISATAEELGFALEELPNIKAQGIQVSARQPIEIDHPSLRNQTLKGYSWSVTFLARAIAESAAAEDFDGLTPNVPQLAVANDRLLVGTNAQVQISTERQGSGNLTQANITEYVLEESRLNSPCVVDVEYRDAQILALNIDQTKLEALHELDANMMRCARGVDPEKVWNDEDECRRVMFSKNTDPNERNDMDPTVGSGAGGSAGDGESGDQSLLSAEGETLDSFCVWRSPDDVVTNLPDSVDPATLLEFIWDNSSYGGTSGLTRFSNCTVPMIYKSQQLLKIFGLSEEFIETYNSSNATWIQQVDVNYNTNISAQLSIFIEQFNQCYEDVQTFIQLPDPKFIKLWQEIVFFTSYTVSLWYGCAGLMFAHRTRKWAINFKSLRNAFLFVVGGVIGGAVLGFVLGCIPAAILANIYAAIPHNLPFPSALSLGIGQGTLIIYFDMGRGMQTTVY